MEANSGHVKDPTEEQENSQTWSITKGQKVSDVAAGGNDLARHHTL